MLGVVIWSDEAESKAIIWCEDHGELAFFGNTPHAAASAERFGEGDLIQFDLTEYRNLRLARNPRKIAGHYCSDLSEVLSKANQVKSEIEAARDAKREAGSHVAASGAVIDFECAQKIRRTG